MRGVSAMLAGDDVQVGSDDAIRVKNDGIVVAGSSDPCCCSGGCGCSNWTSCTVVVSGNTLCACLWPNHTKVESFSYNSSGAGSYSLTKQAGSPCGWSKPLSSVVLSAYDSTDCSGDPEDTDTANVGVFDTGSSYAVLIADETTGEFGLFYALISGANYPNFTSVTVSNLLATCGTAVDGISAYATGGTATITVVCP